MLGIWRQENSEATKAFCELHARESGETIDPDKAALYVLDECPYEGYRVARLHLEPQLIKRKPGDIRLNTSSFTYALVAREGSQKRHKIIPVRQTGQGFTHNIYQINAMLGLRITPENAVKYMSFFGYAIRTPPFYFLDNIGGLGTPLSNLSEANKETISKNVRATFGVDPDGSVQLHVKTKRYPLLGSSYTFEVPCLFEGNLFISKIRVSHDGLAEMDEDRPLSGAEIYDPDESLHYYALDIGPELGESLQQQDQRSSSLLRKFLALLKVDSLLLVWVLPLFAFNVFVVLAIGLHDAAIANYFQHIRSSTLLSLISLVLGFVGVVVAVFRYVFLELLARLKKTVPSVWTYTASQVESELRGVTSRLGVPVFLIFSGAEHLAKSLMCVTLLLYGVAQFWPSLFMNEMSFGQALSTTLAAIPLVGSFAGSVFSGTLFEPFTLPGLADTILKTSFSFLIGTVIIGILWHLYSYTKKADE